MRKSIAVTALVLVLTGCKGIQSFSPEQVMQNALETEVEELSYYGEQRIAITDPDDEFTMNVKEWRSGDKSLEEVEAEDEVMVTLMDGHHISFYDEAENTVYQTEFDHMGELDFNAKDQVEDILKLVEDTHHIKQEGEEDIAGRSTVHIVATKRSGEKSLYGTQEMWIDKENWLVLKTISNTGDSRVEMEYSTITFDDNIEDSVFELDVPDDAVVDTLESDIVEETDLTLEEGAKKLDSAYKYIPEKDEITIDDISYTEIVDDQSMKSIDIDYHLEGLPFITLSIFVDEESEMIDVEEHDEDDMTEYITIRGIDAEYFELEDVRSLSWSEEGLFYSISIIHPNYSLDDLIELVETMKEI